MSWIRRVLAAMIVALLLALGSQPAHAASAPADSDVVHGYSYDIPTVVSNGALERGPPPNLATCTSALAVGLGSYGHFARPEGGTPAIIYTYDCTACRAQAGDSWSTGAEVAPGSSGELSTLRLAGVAAKSIEAGSDVVRYDAKFASRNLFKQTGDGYAVTPGGRTVSAHAADRIVNGAPGRGPSSLSSVDDSLDSATRTSYNPFRDTVKVQGSGRSYVVVSGTGAPHIVTVMIP